MLRKKGNGEKLKKKKVEKKWEEKKKRYFDYFMLHFKNFGNRIERFDWLILSMARRFHTALLHTVGNRFVLLLVDIACTICIHADSCSGQSNQASLDHSIPKPMLL